VARGPKVMSAIRQPASTMNSGEMRRAVVDMGWLSMILPEATPRRRGRQTQVCNYTHHLEEWVAAFRSTGEAGFGRRGGVDYVWPGRSL
jgi:hypothetical protein